MTIPQDFLPNEPTPVRVRSYLIRRGAVVAALDKDANAVSKEVHDAYAACVTCPELDFPHELTEQNSKIWRGAPLKSERKFR